MKTYDSLEEFEREWPQVVDRAIDDMKRDLAKAAQSAWSTRANDRLNATKKHYTDNLKVEEEQDAVIVTVPAGIAAGVDQGTKGFDLKPGFLSPKSKTLALERAPGDKRWRTVSSGGKKRAIPLDGGWPEAPGKGWQHPGIKARDITKDAVAEMKKSVLPELIRAFVARVTV